MATGLPRKVQEKRAFFLSYKGKKSEEEISSADFSPISSRIHINGKSEDNILLYDDNKNALLWLLNNGYKNKINLVYIDPPYATSAIFLNKNQEEAYEDFLCGADFLEFLRERLIIIKELLSPNGSIYVHLDNNMAFAIKIIMDEVFGESNFHAFITRRKCSAKNYTRKTYGNVSDYLLFYSKGKSYTWNRPYSPWDETSIEKEYPCIDEKTGRRYKKVPIHAPGERKGDTGKPWKGKLPPKGKHWQYTRDKLDALDAAGDIYWSPTGNPRRKVYFDSQKGIPIQDIWLSYRDSINQAQKTTGYPTEKNFDMMKMIVEASSNEGEIVLDCFAGSGTTLHAAHSTGRKWIGVDNSKESIKAIIKRFTDGLETYGDYVKPHVQSAMLDLGLNCPFVIMSPNDFPIQ